MAHVPKAESPTTATAAVARASGAKTSGIVDDRELVRRAQRLDKEAFEELVRRHQHRVFAVAGGVLRQREDVEDVAQQVFVKAYFSLKRFDQRAAFSTWLYKITVNECWDLLRKRKVRPLIYESDLSEDQARQFGAPDERRQREPDISEKLEERQRVERLLEGLDERDRTMLILKEVEGFAVE
jgi:RNA polymerase sigma-70 factor (ECF subfamily)